MNTRKVLMAVAAAMVLLVSAGVAYATNSASETTTEDDDRDDSYKGTVSAPDRSGSSLQELAKVDRAVAEQAALKAVPGTVHETELERSDDGYVVYDIEVAGDDGKTHEIKVDAGNGEILHQDLEEQADESDADETDDTEDAGGPGEPEDSD